MEISCLIVQKTSTHTHFVMFTDMATKKQGRRAGRITGSAQICAAFTHIMTTINLEILIRAHKIKQDKMNTCAGGHRGTANSQSTNANKAMRAQAHKPWLPKQWPMKLVSTSFQ